MQTPQHPRKSELPAGWVWTKVADVGQVQLGRQRSPKHHRGPDMRPYLRVANVLEARIDTTDLREMNFAPAEYERYKLAPGDILLNEGQSRELVGRPAIYRGEVPGACFQNTLVRFRPHDRLIPEFALLVFRHYLHNGTFRSIARWTTNLAHLGAGRFAELPFPLPPLAQQREVVDAFASQETKLLAASSSLRRARVKLERYRASVLQAAVEGALVPTQAELGRDYEPASALLERILDERRRRWEEARKTRYKDPATLDTKGLPQLPEGWCWASLESLTCSVRVICYGILMPKADVAGGVPYVKVRDMKAGHLAVDELQRTSPEIAAKYARSTLAAGDLILAIRGTYGRVVHVPPALEGGNITQDSARLSLLPGVDPHYMAACLRSPLLQGYFERVAVGVSVKGVNIRDVRRAPIPLPPTAEQERIKAAVDDYGAVDEHARSTLAVNLRRSERLRQSILQLALEGKS